MNLQKEKDEACLRMLASGMRYDSIQFLLGISPRRISSLKKGLKQCHRIGRPHVLSDQIIDYIELLSMTNARYTDQDIATAISQKFGVYVSKTTIARTRNKLGFIYRPPLVKQFITETQKQTRLEFCRWVIENRTKLENIVFSDESRFERGPDNSWRRIRRGQWNDTCFIEKTKFSSGIMVWGAIGKGYRSPLVRMSGSVDALEYQKVLEQSGMFKTCDMKYGRYRWAFMQDGAPCHNAAQTLEMLSRKAILVPGWPPNSPDLNPIEIVWAIIKKKLKKNEWNSCESVYSVAERIWNNIDQRIIDSLVEDFVRRCQLVIDVAGESISQYISSHVKEIKEKADNSEIRFWTKEEDDLLLDLQKKVGNIWKSIAQYLGRDKNDVRSRFRNLQQRIRNDRLRAIVPIPSIDQLEFDLRSVFGEWSPPIDLLE